MSKPTQETGENKASKEAEKMIPFDKEEFEDF